MNLVPQEGTRSLFLGQTGSGKTHAMLRLLAPFYGGTQIEILDTKADDSIAQLDAVFVSSLDDVSEYPFPEYPMVVYQPSGEELANLDYLDAWCQWIYERKNTVAVIDELTQLGNSTKPRMGFLNLLTRGRSRNITAFMGTQRPVGIPKIAYTESQNFYKFYLADLKDRQRVAEYTHPAMMRQTVGKHGFHYYNPSDRKVFQFHSITPQRGGGSE